MSRLATFERAAGGRAFVVRVVDGLATAGAVEMGGEIVVGRGATEAETEARIAAAVEAAAKKYPEIPL